MNEAPNSIHLDALARQAPHYAILLLAERFPGILHQLGQCVLADTRYASDRSKRYTLRHQAEDLSALADPLPTIDLTCTTFGSMWRFEAEVSVDGGPPRKVDSVYEFEGFFGGTQASDRAQFTFLPAVQAFIGKVIAVLDT